MPIPSGSTQSSSTSIGPDDDDLFSFLKKPHTSVDNSIIDQVTTWMFIGIILLPICYSLYKDICNYVSVLLFAK